MAEIVSYGDHELQKLKFFRFRKDKDACLVLIHGGAWNDPANTYNDFEFLSQCLQEYPDFSDNIVGINYRLSPEIKHPAHLEDVALAISTLVEKYKQTKLKLVGHSAGATLIIQLLDYQEITHSGYQNVNESQSNEESTPKEHNEPQGLLQGVDIQAVYLLDGIYDISSLLEEYPDYISFVSKAFCNEDHYRDATQVSSKRIESWCSELKPQRSPEITIVQSLEDELLSFAQTELFTGFLARRNIRFKLLVDSLGQHEDVYKNRKVADIITGN
ncbi:Piso0_001940 [Millerozyma farinosa CBS 7064]|uniref:Kynurenine formamidase n=1 Tax=Pichia sorbitophila (strain ATCC MYA-4447 / BCRC 22081 / CBS 7064 / NBRC 10061 / NRRL Y-12695) TaxID=559304 RepID=G8YM39_PICSO|nr:Piso0_001940 [Millerozyma farinosa CBS 7064]